MKYTLRNPEYARGVRDAEDRVCYEVSESDAWQSGWLDAVFVIDDRDFNYPQLIRGMS